MKGVTFEFKFDCEFFFFLNSLEIRLSVFFVDKYTIDIMSSDEKKADFDDQDDLCIRTIRVLAADMVEKANSGHAGAPMGLAPVAHILWSRFMNANPKNPHFVNRDRFVLSNGHACALQ